MVRSKIMGIKRSPKVRMIDFMSFNNKKTYQGSKKDAALLKRGGTLGRYGSKSSLTTHDDNNTKKGL